MRLPKPKTLTDVLIEEIRDLYNAEVQLTKALPRLAKAAKTPELKAAFVEDLAQTKGHVERLQQAADLLGASPLGKICQAMQGLVAEGRERIEGDKAGPARDARLICAAQKAEHYEIASYGCVHAFAHLLGFERVAELLRATLDEECASDRKYTDLADIINPRATPRILLAGAP